MKPYYQDDYVTIYHGNRSDGIKEADVLVWDVAYREKLTVDIRDYKCPTIFIFAGFSPLGHYAVMLAKRRLRIVPWTKRLRDKDMGNHERYIDLLLVVGDADVSLLPYYDMENLGRRPHTWARPPELMFDLLKSTEGTVLDPFLGSGTTAVVAKMLKHKCIGYEINKKYCEIAAERCRCV